MLAYFVNPYCVISIDGSRTVCLHWRLCVSTDIGTPQGVGDSGHQERQGEGRGVPEHDEEGHTSHGNRGMGTDCGV